MILPDAIDEPQPSAQDKRRQSNTSEGSAKRPRLTQNSPIGSGKDPIPTQELVPERRRNGHLEERKRGQRLFGALLDTLSQSSSSTAQKRRTDIEKKQQAKLKLQAEEYDEKKKLRLEALMAIRRTEQKKFNQHSVCRHALASMLYFQDLLLTSFKDANSPFEPFGRCPFSTNTG